jgi:hypothetical protein
MFAEIHVVMDNYHQSLRLIPIVINKLFGNDYSEQTHVCMTGTAHVTYQIVSSVCALRASTCCQCFTCAHCRQLDPQSCANEPR